MFTYSYRVSFHFSEK